MSWKSPVSNICYIFQYFLLYSSTIWNFKMTVCCGLIIERPDRESIPVPLIGVSVEARIIDLVAEVTIEQRYINKENQPIEAVYLFPLDEGILHLSLKDIINSFLV